MINGYPLLQVLKGAFQLSGTLQEPVRDKKKKNTPRKIEEMGSKALLGPTAPTPAPLHSRARWIGLKPTKAAGVEDTGMPAWGWG